ncbi:adenylate kinase [Marinicella sp. S1101]|uniref:adenylate kinase n=1 Tax=Marinicella marina TaxID=2996016 RepID=UPI002260ED4C|nr:adenylate kinase [Marinicella marina]MCX7554234.1 adenylate kinase [Marinicella marina]MDJ1138773.1 adenylate kinase [Marinicella marina]
MRIVLLGAPGSGKGTQAKLLEEKLNIPHVSTGDLFRAAIANKTPLGLAAKEVMDRGDLVADEITLGMLKERITQADASNGFILDGFPRNLAQAEMLETLFKELDMALDHALLIQVDPDEVVARIAKRAEIEGRTDDTEEVVRNRLNVYAEQTAPVADYYKKQDIVTEILGKGSIEDVQARIQAILRF